MNFVLVLIFGVTVLGQKATYSSPVFNNRYCEILLGYCSSQGGYALVYSTATLNDCPEVCVQTTKRNPQLWDALAQKWGASVARLNGPRHWTMNAILDITNTTAQTLICFEGHYVANISLSPTQCKIGSPPFSTSYVERDTVWQYNLKQQIYTLTNVREKKTYIMQSYSQEVEPLSLTDLPYLDHIFPLPPGWIYETSILQTSAKLASSCGLAEVIQDPLKNTYQLISLDFRIFPDWKLAFLLLLSVMFLNNLCY